MECSLRRAVKLASDSDSTFVAEKVTKWTCFSVVADRSSVLGKLFSERERFRQVESRMLSHLVAKATRPVLNKLAGLPC